MKIQINVSKCPQLQKSKQLQRQQNSSCVNTNIRTPIPEKPGDDSLYHRQ